MMWIMIPARIPRLLALVLCLAYQVAIASAETPRVFIYYYTWYANPAMDETWLHWQENGHHPPYDIASSFYPKLGAYSSKDSALIDQHMRWIAGANIQALIYSWWGKGDFTDQVVASVLDAAADYNVEVTFLIEPYAGRTARSICNDVEYLSQKYGRHPAFFHVSKTRPMFLIYDPDFTDEELRMAIDEIHNSRYDAAILLQTTDIDFAKRTHADGLFAYEAVQQVADFYPGLVKAAKKNDLMFMPCVSPGFNMNRTRGLKSPLFRGRNYGKTYDRSWKQTLAADPDEIAIISFNEWHEGTQIEPAARVSSRHYNYLSYEGAFGKSGGQAEQSYLHRTAHWIDLFLQTKN